MNNQKFLDLADFIESLPSDRFNINFWASGIDDYGNKSYNDYIDINQCNTAGCIAGWLLAMENNGVAYFRPLNVIYANSIAIKAADILGLTFNQAQKLFIAEDSPFWDAYLEDYKEDSDHPNGDLITSKIAIEVLRSIGNGELKL